MITSSGGDGPSANLQIDWKQCPEKQKDVRDVGHEAIWSLSSCKAGYGVEQLLDNSADTYWQSDGPQPHIINIQFQKKTPISFLVLYVDYKADESYTPSKISVRVGTHANDLREIRQREFNEPCGWQFVDVRERNKPTRAFMVQLAVLQNHQNGRDTHVRQIKIFSPNPLPTEQIQRPLVGAYNATNVTNNFKTVQMNQFAMIR